MKYDRNNIFAKIIDGTVSAEKIFEDDRLVAVKDINPASPFHILVMPRGEYVDFADFVGNASPEDIAHYFRTIDQIAKDHAVDSYRIVSNRGAESGQSVFHFHTHILSGLEDKGLIDKNV